MAMQEVTIVGASSGHHLVFRDERHYDAEIDNPDLEDCQFSNVGLKRATFSGGRIKNSTFENCYLRNARFDRVDLSGTVFTNCNLRHASFDRSKLWYVKFHGCDLDYDNLLGNLPKEQNLRKHALRTLRVNAEQQGDSGFARTLLLEELEAERHELYAIWTHETDYFKNTYRLADRFIAGKKWLLHCASRFLWGYGFRLGVLVRSAAIVVAFFAVLMWLLPWSFFVSAESQARGISLDEALYISATSFSTLGSGDFMPTGFAGQVAVATESIAGAVFVGLLAAAMYRRIRK